MPRLPPSLASLAGDRGRPWHGTGAGSSEWALGLLRAPRSFKTESHPFWSLLGHFSTKVPVPRHSQGTKGTLRSGAASWSCQSNLVIEAKEGCWWKMRCRKF